MTLMQLPNEMWSHATLVYSDKTVVVGIQIHGKENLIVSGAEEVFENLKNTKPT